jgi:hypothetical protein
VPVACAGETTSGASPAGDALSTNKCVALSIDHDLKRLRKV